MPDRRVDEDQSAERQRKLRSGLPVALAIVGWLIIASALNTLLFAILPLRFGLPEWQLTFLGGLLSVSLNLLIGAALICLASLAGTQSRTVEGWYNVISRIAGWFAVVLVLLIPLQFYGGFRALNNQNASAKAVVKNLQTIQFRIRQSDSEAALRGYVASLPNPPQLPPTFDAPFTVIRQRAIDNLQAQINTGTTIQKQQESEKLQLFLKEALRNSVQAILMAAGFARIAQVNPQNRNPITRLFRRMPGWR